MVLELYDLVNRNRNQAKGEYQIANSSTSRTFRVAVGDLQLTLAFGFEECKPVVSKCDSETSNISITWELVRMKTLRFYSTKTYSTKVRLEHYASKP